MKRDQRIKVCGMREPENIREVSELIHPDMMGFIFYDGSPRYTEVAPPTPEGIKRVGVFVDTDPLTLISIARNNQLDFVQLHGNEDVDYIRSVRDQGPGIIKVIRVGNTLDLKALLPYCGLVEFFLFDTAGRKYGGNGLPFSWELLSSYDLETPYLVGGGLNPGNVNELLHMELPGMYGIDLNSGFEKSPALKDIEKLKETLL